MKSRAYKKIMDWFASDISIEEMNLEKIFLFLPSFLQNQIMLYSKNMYRYQEANINLEEEIYEALSKLSFFDNSISEKNEILCDLILQGDKEAAEKICLKNKRIIYNCAKKYLYYKSNDLTLEDLMQVGYIGLLEAVHSFRKENKKDFTAFSKRVICKTMTQYIASLEDVLLFQNVLTTSKKCYISIDNCDENISYEEFMVKSPEDLYINKDLQFFLQSTFIILNDKERYVLNKRYGLNNYDRETLEELGNECGVSRERIRQIENAAIHKLQHPFRIDRIKRYLSK